MIKILISIFIAFFFWNITGWFFILFLFLFLFFLFLLLLILFILTLSLIFTLFYFLIFMPSLFFVIRISLIVFRDIISLLFRWSNDAGGGGIWKFRGEGGCNVWKWWRCWRWIWQIFTLTEGKLLFLEDLQFLFRWNLYRYQ